MMTRHTHMNVSLVGEFGERVYEGLSAVLGDWLQSWLQEGNSLSVDVYDSAADFALPEPDTIASGGCWIVLLADLEDDASIALIEDAEEGDFTLIESQRTIEDLSEGCCARDFIEVLHRRVPIGKDCEVAVECAPGVLGGPCL